MRIYALLVPVLALAAALAHADDKAKHTFPSCRDCGIVRAIEPVRGGGGPVVRPGGVNGVMSGAAGGPQSGRASYTVRIQMDKGGMQTVTVRELGGLELGDKVKIVGLNLEKIAD